ncbi:hypothetical protein [Cohnella sp. WQ 127256]|uniref:hypothetical protein n=1 Tax=Cohnella sp. WQ 127256 TaxID=2938790 RepID=UPI002118CC66|nr:hypothetical protein [Cohnella sp. WQ 127256]
MVNKMLFSFVAVLFGFMSFGFIQANTNDYMPVPRDSDTHVAYIDQIYQKNGKIYLNADFIQWYEGEEANKVFREKEQDPEMTEAPDGYYIVNEDTQLQTLEVAADAKVFMQIYNRTGNVAEADIVWNEEISVAKLIEEMSEPSEMNLAEFPYHLEIHDNKVVKITQQYVP